MKVEKDDKNKYKKLFLSFFMDALGLVSYMVPGLGESIDFIWAPLSSFVLVKMYKGNVGKVGAIVNLIEELTPGLDIIPTFTLTWFYTYYYAKKDKS